MKSTILVSFIIYLLLNISCHNQPTELDNSLNQIGFSTDRSSYAKFDTVKVVITNSSNYDIRAALRCGKYLEMFYQKKENQNWGDSLWFWYMSLRCFTVLDTVPMNTTLSRQLPANWFDSTGTFRLIFGAYIPKRDTSLILVSNVFNIQ